MGASWFVGRVGGLAMALGVGSGLLTGAGVAWADAPDSAADSGAASAAESSSSASKADTGPAGTARGRKAGDGAGSPAPVRGANRSPRAPLADADGALPVAPVARPKPSPIAVLKVPVPAPRIPAVPEPVEVTVPGVELPAPAAARTGAAPTVSVSPLRRHSSVVPAIAAAVLPEAPVFSAPVSAPAGSMSQLDTSGVAGTDGATDDTVIPTDSPLSWAVLAAARRQPLAAASVIDGVPSGQTTSQESDTALAQAVANARNARTSRSVTIEGITVETGVLLDGSNVLGLAQATTDRPGATLVYEALGGSNGGKLQFTALPGIFTALPYATWLDNGGVKGTEQMLVGIRERTEFAQFLIDIPVLGLVTVINSLQDAPFLGDLLAPLIGASIVVPVEVNVAEMAPGDTPIAFTYKVTSFDGTKLSTNFFPAAGLAAGEVAPTTIIGSGFGLPALTDPFSPYALKDEVPGVYPLSTNGYNVVTYDPRGRFDSSGQVHLADPNYEGKDVSALISWIADKTPAALDDPGDPSDPRVGLVGGSYGAALQFAAAADERIDAMVPVDGWDTMLGSIYPNGTFKTAYGALTLLSLVTTGSNVYAPLYVPFLTGMLLNWVGPWGTSTLNATTPDLSQITAPTLMIRGTVDVLFPLDQGTLSAEQILANGNGVPLKMVWVCTGHGACTDPYSFAQTAAMNVSTLAWLNQYVKGEGTPADALPVFRWFDQKGDGFISDTMPFQDGFNDLPPVEVTTKGGLLGIVPILGGSGPGEGPMPVALANGSEARNAINVDIPAASLAVGTQVVGAPTVTMTYQGLGTSKAVYAQVIDKTTGKVLGNVVTPIPVTLNGFSHTVTVDIAEIAYTVGEGDELMLQITSSATPFANGAIGAVNISAVKVTMPNRSMPATV